MTLFQGGFAPVFPLLRPLLIGVAVLFAWVSVACAQVGSDRYSSIVIEASSGTVLSEVNADEPRYPASLTKLMTLYMTFEALRDRRITLHDPIPVSVYAASMSPSKLGLGPGSYLTVEQAILGLITKSANDAAAAMGEFLGGDEDRFAQMMTLRARALGMNRTVFRNASGLPDFDQVTTARDLAILARRLVTDFAGYYGYFDTPSFVFRGRTILNHDRMLQTYPGADGMKTGWIEASGHNLVTSAVHSNVRLIGVVLGAGSSAERDWHMSALLDQSFARLDVPPEGRNTIQVAAARAPRFFPAAQAAPIAQAARHIRSSPVVLRTRAATRLAEPKSKSQSRGGARAGYGIQVGTFASGKAARGAVSHARKVTENGKSRLEQTSVAGRSAWRAQVGGLTASEAESACAALARKRTACFVVRPASGQFASR